MAQIITYRAHFTPMSVGATSSLDTVIRGAAKSEGTIHNITFAPTSAQYQGVLGYLALIRAGVDTSTVQTAITALSP